MRMIIAIVVMCICMPLFAGETTYQSEQYGFSIKPPVVKQWEGSGMVATFLLPPKDGFSDNVNVMIQEYPNSLQEYDKVTRASFGANGMKLITGKLENGVLTYEYSGKYQGRPLHWYSRATKKDDKIYLVTATCAEERWETNKTQLMNAADSFEFKKQ